METQIEQTTEIADILISKNKENSDYIKIYTSNLLKIYDANDFDDDQIIKEDNIQTLVVYVKYTGSYYFYDYFTSKLVSFWASDEVLEQLSLVKSGPLSEGLKITENDLKRFLYSYENVLDYTINLEKADNAYHKFNDGMSEENSEYYIKYVEAKKEKEYAQFSEIINSTKQIYGDKAFFNVKNNELKTYLLFDEVTISNNFGRSRKIKDLVVCMYFKVGTMGSDKDKIRMGGTIEGTRLSMSFNEAKAGYAHSHLSSKTAGMGVSMFCLGTSPIAIINSDLNNFNSFNIEKYELFLYMIKEYVAHESLEGGPFIRMENIGTGGDDYSIPSSVLKRLDHYKPTVEDFNLVYNNGFDVIPTSSLEDNLIKHLDDYVESAYMVNVVNDQEYILDSLNKTPSLPSDYWNNIDIKEISKITGVVPGFYPEEEEVKADKRISKQLINAVTSKIKTTINHNYIKKICNI